MSEREYDIGQGVKLPTGELAYVASKSSRKTKQGRVVTYWVVLSDGRRPGSGTLRYAGSQISPVPVRRKRAKDPSVRQEAMPGWEAGLPSSCATNSAETAPGSS